MDARGLVGVLAIALVLTVGVATLGAAPGPATTRTFTLDVTEVACATPRADGKPCLAYNGQVPGPTLDVNAGDTLVIRLVNRGTEAVSWHVHGMVLPTTMDGMRAHDGTMFEDAYAPPGGEFTYTVRAQYVGTWHYHDHVLGNDGKEGMSRGLFGALLVRNGAEARPDVTLDLHVMDKADGWSRLNATVPIGADVDVAVVGLGDGVWNVTLRSPAGVVVGNTLVGPGVSERLHIEDAQVGDYTWTAKYLFYTHTGKVSVQ